MIGVALFFRICVHSLRSFFDTKYQKERKCPTPIELGKPFAQLAIAVVFISVIVIIFVVIVVLVVVSVVVLIILVFHNKSTSI